MIERVGNNEILVRNYSSNFNVKEFIQEELIPKAFPDMPIARLNLGLPGIASEMISQAIEDSYGTAALMMNESFITRAVLPSSIYSQAALFNLGYRYATPSRCEFALQIWLEDLDKYSRLIPGTNTYRYILDKDTRLTLGGLAYRFDYDVIIDSQFIDGRRAYRVYYDMQEINSISTVNNRHINHQRTNVGWLVLYVELRQFNRKVIENTIADNAVTSNSDIYLSWTNQIAGLDLIYTTPRGERMIMRPQVQHTNPIQDPFCWYQFVNDNQIRLTFGINRGFFQPDFNSRIEAIIYTTNGEEANFDEYDQRSGVPVTRTGSRFEYNAGTGMTAVCTSGSVGGLDKGDIEQLRSDVILANNTVNVITTDNDLDNWFRNYAQRYNTKSMFFKRRDDPTGRLFSQFVIINDNTDIYPTNTLSIHVTQEQFDFINNDSSGNNKEFIIKPGHLWEYVGDSRDTVRMVDGIDGRAMVTDEALPLINNDRPFMFVNPFYIKIHRQPTVLSKYNFLLNHTSWPDDIPIQTNTFYQFLIASMTIRRSLSRQYQNEYRVEVMCVPAVTQDTLRYIQGVGEDYDVENNNLRIVMVFRSRSSGETGYMELRPTEHRRSGSILFEGTFRVDDNLRSDMTLQLENVRSDDNPDGNVISLLSHGPREGQVYIDSSETSLHFMAMIKDITNRQTTMLFDNPSFNGYTMANRYANNHRELTLYQPMQMMRSTVIFAGENDNFNVEANLIPFLKYDVPLDDDRMLFFIRAFNDQYRAMEPVLSRLDGNNFLDFKLFNTYGRSNNYYIGPPDDSDMLWDSDILLDDVYVHNNWRMAVHDRSLYTATVESVINTIKTFFDSLSPGTFRNVHVSDLIHSIKENNPNVKYIRFLGFNRYDANKQSIFLKYENIGDLKENQLRAYVPEQIYVSRRSINIQEEV